MSQQGRRPALTEGLTRLTLKIQHPDCWTLEVTEKADAGMIAHTVYNTPQDTVKGHLTVHATRVEHVDTAIEQARASQLTDSVSELSPRHTFDKDASNIGNTTREIMVEYDPANSMTDALLEYGFVHDAPVRVNDGWEYWPVVDTNEAGELQSRLQRLADEKDAEITVTKVTATSRSETTVSHRKSQLSKRQREVFELARQHDYYTWPRGTTTQELADELGVSKTTVLEHLRTAEAKLLDGDRA